MSVLRQQNFLGQGRVDVPHIRALESSIAADFDVVAGRVTAGGKAAVIRGFTLANFTSGTAASSVQLTTADGILFNQNASEAGTFLWVPADRAVETLNSATNARVDGSFTAGQVNYIGLDLSRTADVTTSDIVQFLAANTLKESPKSVPLGRTLDYRIVISTTPFSSSPNLVPIAKVKTDASNNVDSSANAVQDARNILWRLGSGGDFPNKSNSFTWAQNRTETTSGTAIFTGGDKAIQSQKDWMDAVMTRLWELGGGESWYSPTADRNVRMCRLPSPAVFSSTGDNFEFVTSNLHWQGLKIAFDNANTAGIYYNTITDQTTNSPGLTDIADGECIYVDIDRTALSTLAAKKTTLQSLSTSATPGSRFMIAWRVGASIYTRDVSYPVGVVFSPATTSVVGAVRLNNTANTPATPTVLTLEAFNVVTIGGASYPVTGNRVALIVSGTSGIGAAIQAVGGAGGGAAIIGTGGAAGGAGGSFTGTGIQPGLFATGGATDAFGAQVFGGGTNGGGIQATAVGTGLAGDFFGSSTSGDALRVSGIVRAHQIEDRTGAGLLIGTDATRTTTVTIGNGSNTVLLQGNTAATSTTWSYNSTQTRTVFVPVSDFMYAPDIGTAYQNLPTSTGPILGIGTTGSSIQASAKIRLPKGAVITGVQFLSYNNDGAARNLTVAVCDLAYNSGGAFTKTQQHTGPAGGQVVSQPVTGGLVGTETWKSVTMAGLTSASADGWTSIYFTADNCTVASQVGLFGFRITYTHTLETPMR